MCFGLEGWGGVYQLVLPLVSPSRVESTASRGFNATTPSECHQGQWSLCEVGVKVTSQVAMQPSHSSTL